MSKSKGKYNYHSSKKASSRSYRSEKHSKNDFTELKEDVGRICYDIKKMFSKKTNGIISNKVKVRKTKQEIMARNICLALGGFILMSIVLTFPVALIITIVLAGLYLKK